MQTSPVELSYLGLYAMTRKTLITILPRFESNVLSAIPSSKDINLKTFSGFTGKAGKSKQERSFPVWPQKNSPHVARVGIIAPKFADDPTSDTGSIYIDLK